MIKNVLSYLDISFKFKEESESSGKLTEVISEYECGASIYEP